MRNKSAARAFAAAARTSRNTPAGRSKFRGAIEHPLRANPRRFTDILPFSFEIAVPARARVHLHGKILSPF
jgi:hypothetical protein